MDWVEPMAERIREMLAQQRWLEAWRPTIDATPDWALLAAGPAAVLLLLLFLRLVWPQRSNAPRESDRQRRKDARDPPATKLAHQESANSPTQTAPLPVTNPSLQAPARPPAFDEHGAASHFERDGKRPDSILRCTIQVGDYDSTDFLDGLVGAYRENRFLRILMQNDEPDDPRGYWCSWDVPWSEIVQVILRDRSTPTVHMNVRQPDGTYARKGRYLQTRLYKVGRGMECRLLDRDDQGSAAPFEWLKANISDPEIRFAKDTQEDALYGDTTAKVVGDSLDEYALRLEARSARIEDEAFSQRALALSDIELAELRAAAPQEFKCKVLGEPRYEPKDIASILGDFDRWYATLVEEPSETVSAAHRDYAKAVIERMLLGGIKPSYCGIFFYDHFPKSLAATGAAKAQLLQVVRWMRPDGSFGVAAPS